MTDRLDDRQFQWLSATVAATLAVHFEHLPWWLLLAFAIVLPLRAWTRRRGAAKIGAAIRLPLTTLLVVLVIHDFGNLFGREPGTVLGCGLLALKLLETERVRDAHVALGFAAFVLMSALLFSQSLLFTVTVCAVVIVLLATLIELQPAPLRSRNAPRTHLRIAFALVAASLPLALAAFVLVPRLASPLWGAPGGEAAARTGLSERMAPGSIKELLIDDSPALRVDFDRDVPPPRERYFRALVLWDFDGTAWVRGSGRSFGSTELAQHTRATTLIDYRVTLEPTEQRYMPALDVPLAAPAAARMSADRIIIANEPIRQPRQYRVQSATAVALAPALGPRERARALALPAAFDPKSRRLAQSWRLQGKTDAEIVAAALALFHADFTYTLNPPLLGRDSIDDFLFDTRRGFCEHYSSSFVFLMRAAGIPARVVTGYQGGWWNAASRYLLVRQSDAHAWAEVWTEGRGWQRVDPTAAVSPARIELGAASANDTPGWSQTDWLRSLRNQIDVANRLWTLGIVRFDALRQRSILSTFGVANAEPSTLLYALAAVLGVAMFLWSLWALRRPRAAFRADPLDRAWSGFLRRLARVGIAPRASEGPLDLLDRVRRAQPAIARSIEPLVARYVELRYAPGATAERIDAFARATRKLRLPARVKDSN